MTADELGPPLCRFRANLWYRWRGFFLGLVLLPGAVAFALLGVDAPKNDAAAPLVAYGLAAVSVGVGLLFVRRNLRDRALFLAAHERGIAVREPRGLRCFEWRDVESVVVQPRLDPWVKYLLPHVLRWLVVWPLKYVVKLREGAAVVLTERVFDGVAEVGACLVEASTALLLPRAAQLVDGGGTAQFGPLAIGPRGMSSGTRSFSWDEIGSAELNESYLTVSLAGKRSPWNEFDVASIPNLGVLLRLLARLTSGRLGERAR